MGNTTNNKENEVKARALKLLEKGFKMGKFKFDREEIYTERFKHLLKNRK